MTDTLVCRNITKVYRNNDTEYTALKGVSLTVRNGEFVAIMGPSGSGKSTLMHILGALDVPTAGEYLLDGQNIAQLTDDQLAAIRRSKIGFVFQAFNLLPRATVLRNVMLPLVYAGTSKTERVDRVKESLRASAFPETFLSYHSNQLSGGMMQRVAVARALVNNPVIVLADEPTGNLDTKTGDIVLHTFQSLNERHGKTIVLITHEPYVAEHAQRIIHIRDGLIVSDEPNRSRRVAHGES